MPLATLQDMFVRFPLPPGQEAYANIDGKHMHQYVVEHAAISRRYRDAGHPKFWAASSAHRRMPRTSSG